MKKIISFALAIVIIFSFVGCGSMNGEIKDGINSAPTQAPTPKPTAIPTPAPTPTPDPRIAMREEYSQQIDEAVVNSGVKLVATGQVMTDEDKTIDNVNVYVLKWYTYNEYQRVAVYTGDTIPLLVSVYDANIKTVVPLACSLAPIVDKTMIGNKEDVFKFKYNDLDADYKTGILIQYYTYFNSIAMIQSNLNEDSDACYLTMYLNSNE